MFNTAWSTYPHHANRSKKASSRALWQEITTTGHQCVARVDSSPIKLGKVTETEEALLEAIKSMCMTTPEEELKFVPGFQVYLHQARFLDYDEDERKRLADNYDKMQGTKDKLERDGKLRMVK